MNNNIDNNQRNIVNNISDNNTNNKHPSAKRQINPIIAILLIIAVVILTTTLIVKYVDSTQKNNNNEEKEDINKDADNVETVNEDELEKHEINVNPSLEKEAQSLVDALFVFTGNTIYGEEEDTYKFYKVNKVDAKNLINDEILKIGASNIGKDKFVEGPIDAWAEQQGFTDEYYSGVVSFKSLDMKNSINKILGDLNYDDGDVHYIFDYKYIESLNIYKAVTEGKGGTYPGEHVETKIVSVEKTNSQIIIMQKLGYIEQTFELKNDFIDNSSYKYNIYNDINKTKLLKTIKELNWNENNEEENINFELYYDLLSTYKYIFTLENGEYHFTSMEKID